MIETPGCQTKDVGKAINQHGSRITDEPINSIQLMRLALDRFHASATSRFNPAEFL
jgi:hypothetical protein